MNTDASGSIPEDALDSMVSLALILAADGNNSLAGLRMLDDAFSGDGMLEYALNCVDRGHVARLESPSGRRIFTVASTLSRKNALTFDVASSGIRDGGYYLCVAGSCTCIEYITRLVVTGRQFQRYCCKHALAVRIAELTGKFISRRISDHELARVLDSVS